MPVPSKPVRAGREGDEGRVEGGEDRQAGKQCSIVCRHRDRMHDRRSARDGSNSGAGRWAGVAQGTWRESRWQPATRWSHSNTIKGRRGAMQSTVSVSVAAVAGGNADVLRPACRAGTSIVVEARVATVTRVRRCD